MSNSPDIELKKALIAKQACFTEFTPGEVEVLSSLLVETHFKAGDVIVHEGDPVDSIYLIVKGTTEVRHVRYENQQPHTEYLATLKEGDAIGLNEFGFYSLSGKRTATVVATSDVVTLRLSVAEFKGFALAYSHVNQVMREQAKKIHSD